MPYREQIRVILTGPDTDACQPLLQAMQSEGWDTAVMEDLKDCAASASSGACHLVVVVSNDPDKLPREPVRTLMTLRVDTPVHFLIPAHVDRSAARVLAGATSDQVHKLSRPVSELMEVFKEELRCVLLERPRYTIMYVDDDREFLASLEAFLPDRLRNALPRFELDFEFFDEPLVALEACDEIGSRLSIVVSDQVMPNLCGIELLTRIKELHPRVRCVLLTGQAGLESAVTAINKHILHKYVFKPVDPVDFSESLRLLLSEYHLGLHVETRQDRMMSQFEYIRAVTSASKPSQVLCNTLSFLNEQVGPAQVQVALMQNGQMVLKSASPRSTDVNTQIPLDTGIWAWMAKHQRPLRVRTKAELPADAQSQLAPPLMAAPMLRDNTFLGGIIVSGPACGRGFTREAAMLLNFVADVAAVSLGSFTDRAEVETSYVSTMASLMETIEAKDSYTRGHTERVRILATELAKSLGIRDQLLQQIEWAAALHDIGKISLPDAILQKPGALTAHEYSIMKAHTTRGDRILRHLRYLHGARMIIRSHHERFDGAGYPDGLAGEDIPFGARILAIADSYDAMTSQRPYRPAMDVAEALSRIQAGSGSQFDPQLADQFLELMRLHKDTIAQAVQGA